MLGVRAVQFEFGFQRNAVSQPAFNAFLDAVPGRVNEIIQEFQHKVVPGIRDREILCEYFVKTLIDTILRVGLQLKKILEGFYLNIKKIGILVFDLCGSEIDPVDFV
jgi:hypothetical protein